MMDPETLILAELDRVIAELYDFCVLNGVTPDHKTLSCVTGVVKKFRVLNPTITYYNVNINEFGYIQRIGPLEDLIDFQHPTPVDVEDGYYKLVGNKYVLDERMKDYLFPDIDRF